MLYNLPMKTRDTTVWVRGVMWYGKIKYRTRTCDTHDENTAGFSVPVLYPKSTANNNNNKRKKIPEREGARQG